VYILVPFDGYFVLVAYPECIVDLMLRNILNTIAQVSTTRKARQLPEFHHFMLVQVGRHVKFSDEIKKKTGLNFKS
jgi:hypothetical protein